MMKLVGDIGGTNARFALVSPGTTEPQQIEVLACAQFANFPQALEAYLQSCAVERVSEAAIAVGMPVVSDWLEMTNNHWAFSRQAVQRAFELERLLFTNDFTALALSVPLLEAGDSVAVGGGQCLPGQTVGVIGPGTGLGVSGLVRGRDGCWVALQGEGGHVTLAPRTARQRGVVEHLQTQFPHVSAERFLSGPGLGLIHQALRKLDGLAPENLTAADIATQALSGSDEHCAETLSIFCSQLGSVAADLALTLGAEGGVYIGGGIVPRLGEYFHQSEFRAAFEDKGRMSSYLKQIATRVIVSEYPALRGVATLLL